MRCLIRFVENRGTDTIERNVGLHVGRIQIASDGSRVGMAVEIVAQYADGVVYQNRVGIQEQDVPAPGDPEPFVVRRPKPTFSASGRYVTRLAVTLVDNAFGVVLRVVVDDDDLVDDVFGFVEDRIDRLHE